MEPVRFRIFMPSNKSYWSINTIYLTILGILLVALLISTQLFNNDYGIFEKTILWIIVVMFFLGAIIMWVNLFRRKSLNGKLTGYLEFQLDKIIISKKEYQLIDIEKLEVFALDYLDKRTIYLNNIDPCLSNGVSNRVDLTLRNENKLTTYFQLFYENEIQKISTHMIEYHLQGKVSLLSLCNFLNITDYEKIQEFKKTISTKKINLSLNKNP